MREKAWTLWREIKKFHHGFCVSVCEIYWKFVQNLKKRQCTGAREIVNAPKGRNREIDSRVPRNMWCFQREKIWNPDITTCLSEMYWNSSRIRKRRQTYARRKSAIFCALRPKRTLMTRERRRRERRKLWQFEYKTMKQSNECLHARMRNASKLMLNLKRC